MRIFPTVILALILNGCGPEVSETTALDRLDPLATAHASALAGDDLAAMRRTGRDLIATLDAARGVQ